MNGITYLPFSYLWESWYWWYPASDWAAGWSREPKYQAI